MLTRRLSSGTIDAAFGASGATTRFANYNDPKYAFCGLCIDPVPHGLVLVGDVYGGGAVFNRSECRLSGRSRGPYSA